MRHSYSSAVLLVVLAFAPLSRADLLINFETLPDSTSIADATPLTTQFAGLTFSDTTVITAGISLDQFEFPPHSGTNAAFDDGGPMTVTFTNPVLGFSGYFTYAEALTLTALDTHNNPLAPVHSLFSNNEALSGVAGSSPNELLSLSFAGGISEVTITGDPAGTSFTVDDVTVRSSTAVPEPVSSVLLATVVGLVVGRLRKRQNTL